MKTMIWKELRENAKWAALCLFGLLLAEVFALSSGRDSMGNDSSGVTVCSDTFLLVSLFGCAAIGAALGALQVLPERRRDQWANLLHRPVPRDIIFLGKVVSGLMLYVVATGLPLLVSIIDAAWPGQFAAPFVPGLVLPPASDLLLGVVFYFAALLLGMHSGRWFGSRGAIALSLVLVLFLHIAGFWPFLLPLGATAVFATASWGAIYGPLPARPRFSRWAFGLAVLAGMTTGAVLLGAAFRAISPPTVIYSQGTSISIAADGSLLRMKYNGPNNPPTLTDMEGNIVTDERYLGNKAQSSFLYASLFASREFDPDQIYSFQTKRATRHYLQTVEGNYNQQEIWYLIRGPRSHFVGYDKLSGRRIGICDADGFKDRQAAPHPFAQQPQGSWYQMAPYFYRIGSQVFTVDFTERRMTPLLNLGSESFHGVSRFPDNSDAPRVAVALGSEIRILDVTGQQLLTIPYGHDPNKWTNVAITATQDFSRIFLQYSPSFYFVPKDAVRTIHLDVLDAQGRLIATYATNFGNTPALKPTWLSRIAGLLDPPIILFGSIVHKNQLAPPYSQSWWSLHREWQKDAVIPLGIGTILLCGVAWFCARRNGLSARRTAAWVALTFAFGVAGLLAYRLATDWPTRVSCPNCARRRSVTTNACPHCHEPWASVPANGTEIFEPA